MCPGRAAATRLRPLLSGLFGDGRRYGRNHVANPHSVDSDSLSAHEVRRLTFKVDCGVRSSFQKAYKRPTRTLVEAILDEDLGGTVP